MSLYPSLEDMQVHKMVQAQENAFVEQYNTQAVNLPAYTQNPYPQLNQAATPSAPAKNPLATDLYPGLGDFMGLELSDTIIALNMPEYAQNRQVAVPYGNV